MSLTTKLSDAYLGGAWGQRFISGSDFSSLKLGRLLGEGASGKVHEVRLLGRPLVVKEARPGFESVLLAEARSLALCGGWFSPALFGLGRTEDGALGLLLEEVPGTCLRAHLTDRDADPDLAQSVLVQGAAALLQLHAWGLAHCDVKPENILVEVGKETKVRLIDFGLVTPADEVSGGTRDYLPPAVLTGSRVLPSFVDAYALARTVAEILVPELRTAGVKATPEMLAGLSEPFRQILGAVLFPVGPQRLSVRWMAEEAGEFWGESVESSLGQEAAIRREYLATRLWELESTPCERSDHLSGICGDWMFDVKERLFAIQREEGHVHSVRSGQEGLFGASATTGENDLSPHDRRRFLGRLLGPSAVSFKLPSATDSELVLALLRAARSRPLRAVTQSDLRAELLGESDTSDALATAVPNREREISWAFLLGQRPVELSLLRQISLAGEVPEGIRVEAGTLARQMGQLALAERLLSGCTSDKARLERAQVYLRRGEKETALRWISELEAATEDRDIRSACAAHRARVLYDLGEVEDALSLLRDTPQCAARGEVLALCLLSRGDLAAAHQALDEAESMAQGDERKARLCGVRGMVLQREGEAKLARRAFLSAAEQAGRIGAALEEATFATGVAAAASDEGRWGEAQSASERAERLFEALHLPSLAARALLARAAVLAALGAGTELRTVVRRGLGKARQGRDIPCEAYLYLCLSDGSTDPEEKKASARRAFSLLKDSSPSDRLRAATRIVLAGDPVPQEALGWAEQCQEAEAKIEWLRARAEALLRVSSHPISEASRAASEDIIFKVRESERQNVPLFVLGPALVAAGQLALRVTMADEARELLALAKKRAVAFLELAPPEYRSGAEEILWVRQARGSSITEGSGTAQLADVEGLLRTLSQRRGLRAMLDQVLDLLLLWTGVERGLLLLRAPGGKLVARAGRNLKKNDLSREQRVLSQSMAERALSEGRPVVAVDATSDMSQIHRSVHALHLRSVLAVPLTARGEILGVAYLDDKVRRGAFGEKELSWVSLISTVAAVAIADEHDRLKLLRALRRTKRAERRLQVDLSTREAELEIAERELMRIREGRKLRGKYEEIIGRSPKMTELLSLVDRVAQSEIPVLIQGESGTGKELIARAITQTGARGDKPLIAENCSAVPETLLESTLFGHQKGAFTGASRNQTGLFELAHKGTLFLDEIGDMSLGMQAKLLRVLQEGEVRPLGADRTRKVDVRVIVATHIDLKQAVEAGRFREDLYYRLNVVTVHLPPLRQRREDVPVLIQHFLKKYSKGAERRVSPAAQLRLANFSWPGNVRQLENEVRRMLVLGGEEITAADLSPEILSGSDGAATATTLKEKVDALERRLVLDALEEAQGNRTRAAEALGISRFGLQKMTVRLGIDLSRNTPKAGRSKDRGLDESQ